MCAIFGSSNFNTYLKLYKKGRQRGEHAYGSLILHDKCFAVMKEAGIAKLEPDMIVKHEDLEIKLSEFSYYLGHTQAPTSAIRTFDPFTSHPFRQDNWIVAHNGVLTNYKLLTDNIKDKNTINIVDSSIIPALLKQNEHSNRSEVDIICNVLSQLKGTFGLWIYSKESSCTYLARSGSTLYANFLNNDFSSVKTKGMSTLTEGELYLITEEGITTVGNFQSKSPFIIFI